MRLTVLILLLLALPLFAQAQDLSDSDYVDLYFGTRIAITMTAPVADQQQVYWAELLPEEYMYGQATLVKIINDARRAEGRDDLLEVSNYPINIGLDNQLEDGSWEYGLEFHGCTPAEAQLVLDQYALGDAFADAEVTFEPLKIAYFSVYANDVELMVLELPGGTVEIDPANPVESYFDDINALLAATYGDNFVTDVYYSAGRSVGNYNSASISVTIYLDGAEETLNYGYYDY